MPVYSSTVGADARGSIRASERKSLASRRASVFDDESGQVFAGGRGWEQGVPAPNGRIAKRWWQRLLGQASRRGLNADAVRDLINEWPLARADPIPADLHELEEVLVA
jgi:hypothetical protein